jgi:predicted RNA-binding Zn-ribbon protein involved in translation (DUF1610 family)
MHGNRRELMISSACLKSTHDTIYRQAFRLQRDLDPNPELLGDSEDWEGNNAAFTCPLCDKVFIVSVQVHKVRPHRGERKCPKCGNSRGIVEGGRKSGGAASIIWPDPN